ncbi:hypothetical protein Ahy_B05g077632 [Arachis hypogaea]|uniref:Protein FAR1-RELATED SEQUENCE n=1 Tax=Arachis hypogaea TaxID=3818 RepID=A0A444Z561_ARAHY|nr:hypothetical protein Ahy_B05g077632 [Arachis hypogaea]
MNDSTPNQLNDNDLVYSSETNDVDEFYKHYSKLADFSTKIRNTTRDGDKINNQLIVCTREGRRKSKISPTLKTNPLAGLNYSSRIYVQIMKDSHPCCPDRAEMLKQHKELSMFVPHTIETNKEFGIRPSKTYQLFVAAAGSHRELSFIEKDVRNYIKREKLERFPHKVRPRRQQVAPRKVQAQFRGKVNCITRSMHSTLGFTTYEVVEQVSNSTINKFLVTYYVVSRECLLFELRGILCRHSLSILSFERVDNNIKRRHTHIKSSQDEPLLEPRSKRFDDLVFRSHNICEFASESEELNKILHRAFDKVMAEMQEYQEKSKEKSSLSHEETTLSDMNDLQIPPHVKTRGRPKNRLGPNLEKKISNATKKKKKIAPIELNLLDCGSTIQSSSSLYNAPDINFPREDYRSFSFY